MPLLLASWPFARQLLHTILCRRLRRRRRRHRAPHCGGGGDPRRHQLCAPLSPPPTAAAAAVAVAAAAVLHLHPAGPDREQRRGAPFHPLWRLTQEVSPAAFLPSWSCRRATARSEPCGPPARLLRTAAIIEPRRPGSGRSDTGVRFRHGLGACVGGELPAAAAVARTERGHLSAVAGGAGRHSMPCGAKQKKRVLARAACTGQGLR